MLHESQQDCFAIEAGLSQQQSHQWGLSKAIRQPGVHGTRTDVTCTQTGIRNNQTGSEVCNACLPTRVVQQQQLLYHHLGPTNRDSVAATLCCAEAFGVPLTPCCVHVLCVLPAG